MQPALQNGSSKLQSRWILDRPFAALCSSSQIAGRCRTHCPPSGQLLFRAKSSYIWPYYDDNAL